MLKITEVMCPVALNLFLNARKIKDDNSLDIKLINQTINLYDIVYLRETKQDNPGTHIKSEKEISEYLKENILKIVNLFFDITNINPDSFFIEIEKNQEIENDNSIIAGVLIGLNQHYQTNLTKKQLIDISLHINSEIPYFIVGGYSKITNDGRDIERLGENPFQNYLIIDSGIVLDKNNIETSVRNDYIIERSSRQEPIHNDYIKFLPQELTNLRSFLKNYPDFQHSLSSIGPIYFVTNLNNFFSSKVSIALQKEFPKMKFYNAKNTSGHKIMFKYPSKKQTDFKLFVFCILFPLIFLKPYLAFYNLIHLSLQNNKI